MKGTAMKTTGRKLFLIVLPRDRGEREAGCSHGSFGLGFLSSETRSGTEYSKYLFISRQIHSFSTPQII
jgi:hypothetical protein